MSVSDEILQVYQRFYAQRSVLGEAPPLTIDPDAIGVAAFPTDKAMSELKAVALYLMGKSPNANIPFSEQLNIVENAYREQPFWQELLFDYLNLSLNVEELRLKQENADLRWQVEEALSDARIEEDYLNKIITHFADKIAQAGFRVDGENLIRNYFKMARTDEEHAWEVLTVNPAYFSPIITRDETGKVHLSPQQAIAENARLAHFLKGVKG